MSQMVRTMALLAVIVMCGILAKANVRAQPILPYMDTKLDWDKRVDDLVSRLTLEEIVPQTSDNGPVPGIDRLGIKPYVWSTECIRGEVGTNTTAFPPVY